MVMEKPPERPEPANAAPPSKLSLFVKKVGEYKEFVALVVFFLGGIFWAFAYFATKAQLKEIQCIMNANMNFIQGKMDSSSLSQLMLDNLKASAALEKTGLTPEEIVKSNQLKLAATEIARKLADADNATAKALDKLKSGDCLSN